MNEGFLSILLQMVILFATIAVGYVAKKCKVMDDVADRKLSTIILNTALPAMILASVLTAEELPPAADLLLTLGLAAASDVLVIVLAFVAAFALHINVGHRGVFRFMMTFGNVGFIGYPVLSAIFGQQAIIYAAMFNLLFNFLVFSLGVFWVASDNDYGVKVRMRPRDFLSPSMVACVAAIVLAFLGVHDVPVVGAAVDTLGSMTTPAALLIIGSSLANLPVPQLLGGPRLWAAAAVRLLVAPLLLWALFSPLVSDPLLLGVIVVISGMPVATNGTMLCYQYHGDSKTMAQGTFVTTVLSMVTIPILVMVLG